MARASFELERLELDEGRLLVSGWWSGVRGMRFVRPALLVDGRKMLATLEHKPWAIGSDGSWTAAFPWKDEGPPDVTGVMLAVAPSVEVPLDAESAPPAPEPVLAVVPPPADPEPRAEITDPEIGTLREELQALERRLEVTREELHETRALAAEREARCRELEQAATARRRDTEGVEAQKQELLHAHAMAVLDRDRAIAQREEAVADRQAAVRTRTRMEIQRDEALQAQATAEARRDAAIAERDEMRRQRDEVLLAHRALQDQRRGELAAAQRHTSHAERAAPAPAPDDERAGRRSAPAHAHATDDPPTQPFATPAPPPPAPGEHDAERPSGVRVIPAARTVATHLHRAHRAEGSGVTQFDLWVMRILGTVAAIAFIALLVMILKAFFVF